MAVIARDPSWAGRNPNGIEQHRRRAMAEARTDSTISRPVQVKLVLLG